MKNHSRPFWHEPGSFAMIHQSVHGLPGWDEPVLCIVTGNQTLSMVFDEVEGRLVPVYTEGIYVKLLNDPEKRSGPVAPELVTMLKPRSK